jgi:hypothetical protein
LLTADLPVRYVRSSDPQMVAAGKAEQYDELQLLRDRREGKYVVSYKTPGGWVAITKTILTEVLATGRDVRIELPPAAARALTLLCPGLVIVLDDVAPGSSAERSGASTTSDRAH